MSNIRIITDSSSDLNMYLAKKYGITVVPLNIHFSNEIIADGSLLNCEFYERMSSSEEIPKTSHPSAEAFLKNYEGNEDLIVITISSKLSSTYATASLAKLMCEDDNKERKIAVIDSETGSIGQGQLAIMAAKLIEEEKSFEEIVEILESAKKQTVFYGVLDTLENAIKGGRVTPLTGKIVSTLNFKVLIKVGTHNVSPIGKSKGYDNALEDIKDLIRERCIDTSEKSLFIGHANNLPKAMFMKDLMLKYFEFESIHVVEVGAAMGTYTGEGAILVSIL